MDFYTFAGYHPFLTFFIALIGADVCMFLCGRSLRAIMVTIRGWPANPKLDADGDFKKEKTDD